MSILTKLLLLVVGKDNNSLGVQFGGTLDTAQNLDQLAVGDWNLEVNTLEIQFHALVVGGLDNGTILVELNCKNKN